jgi:hypothetical protein
MVTQKEILQQAADKASAILRIPHRYIDTVKFVRLYSLLYTVIGGDEENMRWWLNTFNSHLNFCPASRLTDEHSLDKIIAYLETFVDR